MPYQGHPGWRAPGARPYAGRMDSFFGFIRNLSFRRGPRRVLAGLGGGIADATNLDVVLVRVLMIIAFLLPLIGPTLYVVLWILLPWQDGSIPLERWIQRLGGNRNSNTIVQ